jgi:hypothetical protein
MHACDGGTDGGGPGGIPFASHNSMVIIRICQHPINKWKKEASSGNAISLEQRSGERITGSPGRCSDDDASPLRIFLGLEARSVLASH